MALDLSKTVGKIKSSLKKDERRADQFGSGDSLPPISYDPKDYVVMPEWWKEHFGVLGLRFGQTVQIAGDPDSGKTSLSLVAIKAAQEQNYGVIYVETEGKTGPEDLENAGIDPKGVITVSTGITEEVYDGIARALDALKDDHPNLKVLLIIDSFGNTTSMRDASIDMTTQNEKPGGHGKSNRTGLGAIRARQLNQDIAMLVVNYNYDNIGGVGKTNAGGKAIGFYSMLIIQSSRTKWYEKTVSGVKVRAGAFVRWVVTKNHYAKALKDANGKQILLPKECNMKISGDGMVPVYEAE